MGRAHRPRVALVEHPVRNLPVRARWRRRVGAALLLVIALAVFYLVVVNVLLRTRLLRNTISGAHSNFGITGTPAALRLDYDGAYSIVPGRVHIDGLTIRGRERTVEWFLSLDHADVAISLFDLLRRSFHATRLRSSGFSLRARLRLDPAAATPQVLAALPPIAGLADPPILDYGPEPPPLTDATYKLWMVDLEDVDVEHVHELWIHTVRSEGDTRVRGRWIFRPGRWLDVGPATVDADGVDISYGNHPLASGLRGTVTATVHPFDLGQVKELAIFDHVSTTAQLDGFALVAGALDLVARGSGVAFRRWEGPVDIHMILDHGALVDGTRARIDATDCELEASGLDFDATIRSEFRVDRDLATFDNRISGLRVSHLGAEQGRVDSIGAAVTSQHLRLATVFDDARFRLDLGGAETDDIGHFLRPESTWALRSGITVASGHADGSLVERRGRADLRLSARRLIVERGKDRFTGDLTTDARLDDFSLPQARAAGAATVVADDATVQMEGAIVAGGLAAHVDLTRGSWDDKKLEFSRGNIAVRVSSVRSAEGDEAVLAAPSITAVAEHFILAASGMDGRVSVDVPEVDLLDLGKVHDLVPLPAGLRINAGRGRATLHAEVELGTGTVRGAGRVSAREIQATAGSTALFGNLDCAIVAKASDSRGAVEFSGSTIAITRGGTGKAAPSADPWWGTITLREAKLRTSGGVRFDAKAQLTAKDASLATVLVAQNSAVPSWATNIFRMPALEADADILVGPALLEVRSLIARGGGTSVQAEYMKRDGRQDGAVFLDLGWISLGYDLSDGASGLVLVGPEGWFRRKSAGMRDGVERETDARAADSSP